MADEKRISGLETNMPARESAEKVLRVRLGMVRERLTGAPWISDSLKVVTRPLLRLVASPTTVAAT
jgi:hypothetical protein